MKSLKSIAALASVCAVIAIMLAVTNYFTAPIIAENEEKAVSESLLLVMPNGKDFEKMDISALSLPEIVSEAFCGTAYSSSGFFWVTPDRMEILRPEPDGLTVERYDAGVPVPSSLYHREMLETKDKYRLFLGGNSPRIVLDTGKADLPSLLIIRDSYSDSFVPFLPEHFSRIHLLDLRYFRNSIQDYIREEGIDRVLVMYSVNNFCSDSNLMLMTQ